MDLETINRIGLKCLWPRKIKVVLPEGGTSEMYVPCGKCYTCLSARKMQWQFRLEMESALWKNPLFLTLTMNDKNYHDLRKEDLQKFFKRLRKHLWNTQLEVDSKLKYYAIGEYGTHTHRAHYHVLLFTDAYINDDIEKIWKLGMVHIGTLTPNSIGYVLHYHIRPKEVNGKKTFCLMSKGIGRDWFTLEMQKFIEQKSDFMVKTLYGTNGILPRYYRKKFLSPKPFDLKPKYELPEKNVRDFDYLVSLRQIMQEKLNKFNEQDKL